jgi:succinoglycan biosynthesis transport protein ExoP
MVLSENDSLTLQDIIDILVRWRKLAIVTFLTILLPAVLVIFLMPPLFQASALIMVNRQSNAADYSVSPQMSGQTGTFRSLDRQEEINAHVDSIMARSVIEGVISKLDITKERLDHIRDFRKYIRAFINFVLDSASYLYDETKYFLGLSSRPTEEEVKFLEHERLVDNVRDRLQAQPESDSSIIAITFKSSDAFLARDVANAIVDEYLNFYAKSRDTRARTFFSEESEALEKQLAEAESRLSEVRRTSNAYAVDQQRTLLLTQLSNTREKLGQAESQSAQLRARIAVLRKFANEPKFRDEIENARINLAIADAEIAALNEIAAKVESQLAGLGDAELKIRQIEREVRTLENAYLLSVKNREQAQVIEERAQASLADVRMVDVASLPLKPIRPKKLLYLGIALAVSIVLAIAAPFFAHFNDTTLYTEKDVKYCLGIDVVASFPKLKNS